MNRGSNNAYQYDFSTGAEETIRLPRVRETQEEKAQKKEIVLTELKKKKEDRKVKRGVILNIAVLVALGLTVAFRYASVTQINYENHALEKEYEQLNAVAENIELDIESSMSISEIANEAEKRLGMHKPLSYQVKHITVDTIDQVEYKNTEFTKELDSDAPWYERAYESIKLFLGLI